eukprot:163877_1
MSYMDQKADYDEKQQYYYSEDEDDCTQEAFINPNDTSRRKAIYTTPNANDDIIKCIGSLRIEYDDKQLLTNPPETSIGTGTIIKIDDTNRCHILTVAHNACQALRECAICKKRTIKLYCSKCNQNTLKLKPIQLIKPTSIHFARRCIVKKRTDNNGIEYTFGDPETVYEIDECFIPNILYNLWISPMAGYDICIMIFKCNKNEIKMYKNICSRILLKYDPQFGGGKNRLYLYGYPGDKYKIENDIREYQMYGMSSGMNKHKFEIGKYVKNNKEYIINNSIDTQPGQSGSCIFSYNSGNKNNFVIYGIHCGGNAANIKKGRKFGVNYATFLDKENLNWIKKIENALDVRSSFGNNKLQLQFEQIEEQYEQQLKKLKDEFIELEKTQKTQTKTEITELKKLNNKAMKQIEEKHGQEIKKLKDEFEKTQKTQTKTEIIELKKLNNKAMKQIQEKHGQEIKKLKDEFEKTQKTQTKTEIIELKKLNNKAMKQIQEKHGQEI